MPIPNQNVRQWSPNLISEIATEFPHRSEARQILIAARTYYVRTDGSDSNTGLANTAGGAFLTIQHAIDVVSATLDLGIYDVTIQLAAGTYSTSGGNLLKQCVTGGGKVIIQGDTGTPSNVIVKTTASSRNFDATNVSTTYKLSGMKLTSDGGGGYALYVENSYIEFGNIDFNASFWEHIQTSYNGIARAVADYSVTGGATSAHWGCLSGKIICQSRTITITGTPAFGYWASIDRVGLCDCHSCTFSGSATGTRYTVTGNSVIYTNSGGATYLPGNVAGSAATGGQYI